MQNHVIRTAAILIALALFNCLEAEAKSVRKYECVAICLGAQASPVEHNAAALLAKRLNPVPVRIETENAPQSARPGELRILFGVPAHHAQLRQEMEAQRIPPLSDLDPGPEGFVLSDHPLGVVAAGIDARGVVYAVGELLRNVVITDGNPARLTSNFNDIRTAPAFEIRGTQYGQSGVALTKANVRPWTTKETLNKIADFILAGANTMTVAEKITESDPAWQFLKSLDIKTLVHYGPNIGQGPPEWQGKESIGRPGYLCPSVPEARQALLDKADAYFSKTPHFDYVSFTGGDGGGCECDRCDPYGKTFIHLCEDMAAIVHKYHPNTQIFFTNQKFDNADDQAIFQYLQEKPRTWLRAFCYGPGSDAMSWQPGHRQTHRMDLFQYPGFGPYSRYLHEILHQLPPQQDILFYNELTHWRYSQNGYVQAYPRADKNGDQPPPRNHFIYERMPDYFINQVYDRLTFYAWPRYYHWAFGETVRYGIGDVTHSSGTHDHFNQWMWQRLLWNPQLTVEQAVDAYARAWFGPDAAEPMARAIFLMEQYLQQDPARPLPQKDEVDQYYDLVKEAGARMQPSQLAKSWLWREYMQKGAIDKRTKLAAAQQLELQDDIEARMAKALDRNADLDAAADKALHRLAALHETNPMRALRKEAELIDVFKRVPP
ncbi:MAG: hypothetical protein RBU21_11505, partial [FCB group bacterium]|nr:hypothetical protein [FCB group bacterium]